MIVRSPTIACISPRLRNAITLICVEICIRQHARKDIHTYTHKRGCSDFEHHSCTSPTSEQELYDLRREKVASSEFRRCAFTFPLKGQIHPPREVQIHRYLHYYYGTSHLKNNTSPPSLSSNQKAPFIYLERTFLYLILDQRIVTSATRRHNFRNLLGILEAALAELSEIINCHFLD